MIRKYLQGGIVPFSNPTYPMARLQGSIYAAPLNYNQPNEVVGGYDARVNPMTGEEIPQANFADGGPVSYGEGSMLPAAFYTPPMDRTRVGFDPNERYLRENAMQGGIGPYIDMLNQQFAAGPRYGTRTGITGVLPWVNPTDFPVNPQPSTQPSGPTGGSVNPITGGTYTYQPGETGEIVPDDGSTGVGVTGPVLPPDILRYIGVNTPYVELPPIQPEQEKKSSVTVEELAPEEQGTPYIDERGVVQMPTTLPSPPAPMGGITLPQEPQRKGSVTAEELPQDSDLTYLNMDTLVGGAQSPYQRIEAPFSGYGGVTLPAPEPRGSVSIDTNVEQPAPTGIASIAPPAYSYGQTYEDFNNRPGNYYGFANPQEAALYESMATSNRTEAPSFRENPSGWLANKLSSVVGGAVEKAKQHPFATAGNVVGSLLTGGVPHIGDAVAAGYDYLTRDPIQTGLTPEEEALYAQVGATQTPSETAQAEAEPTPEKKVVEPRTGIASLYAPPSNEIGPGSLSGAFRGTADINAINFLTGAFNGLPYGSPTSMVDMSSMIPPYAGGAVGADGSSFYDNSQELRDYAASHPIGTADPFREDRNAYFAAHPELNPTTGRLYEQEKTPQEIAAAKAIADEYRALQEAYGVGPAQESAPAAAQEAAPSLDDYYAQLYGMNNYAAGGLASLPEYRAGGKLLRGPGDGMSDDIKANIDGKQEARLATGEFVFPADVVSHLGNGDTEAGAERLYEMMDKIRMARTGSKKQGKQINPHKFLPV